MAIEVRGSSTAERLLEASQEQLAPHHSLQAVADASGKVVGAVAVAGALTTGLGLFSASALTDVGIGWAIPTVVFTAASTALAIWASVPSRETLAPGDYDQVKNFFATQIACRGKLIRGAAVIFGLAILTTPLPLIVAAASTDSPSLGVTATREGGRLKVVIRADHLPEGARVSVTINSGGRPIMIGSPGQDGKFSGAVITAATRRVNSVRTTVTQKRKAVLDRVTELGRL